ncbi:CHASE3 domain-containing protein [Granulicella cerasi]|uniref:histidine kinase n=1 Tax=Granulicella cerasi TaxID=741063 RepID=A0ABW1Z9I0_9BACT|nr:sensor histidine kinase [Granulicella cerasi]
MQQARRKIATYRIATVACLFVVLLNTWIAGRAVATLFQAEHWLAHTLEVLTQTQATLFEVSSANNNVRAYMLTGDPQYSERFAKAQKGLEEDLDRLQADTSDSKTQQARIRTLRSRVAVRMEAMESVINLHRRVNGSTLDQSLVAPALNESPDGGISVRYALQQIENEERRLLDQRTRDASSARRNVIFSVISATVLDIVLLLLAFELMVRAQRSRLALADRAEVIAKLNADLQATNATLEERVQERTRELQVSNQELEAFSYSVSHDLRAPLRTIDGFSLALKEDFSEILNEEGQDYINRVRNGVQRMGSLIDALLQLSRVTRSEVQRERVDLSQLATNVFNELQAAEPDREVQWVAQPGVQVLADPRLIRIALENLIGNAWKFTSRTPSPRIEFGSSLRDEQTVYFIRDNGAGFDMYYVDRLFTAFQRLHGDRDFKGSGIGLATVSRIIRRHHGNISAESQVGLGATFYFSLGA